MGQSLIRPGNDHLGAISAWDADDSSSAMESAARDRAGWQLGTILACACNRPAQATCQLWPARPSRMRALLEFRSVRSTDLSSESVFGPVGAATRLGLRLTTGGAATAAAAAARTGRCPHATTALRKAVREVSGKPCAALFSVRHGARAGRGRIHTCGSRESLRAGHAPSCRAAQALAVGSAQRIACGV